MKVAAVDIGASSGRVLLAELRDDRIALEELIRFPNGPIERDGRWTWDVDALTGHVIEGLALAAERGAQAFGIDTWACDYGVIGPDGVQIGPVYAYRDPRHAEGGRRMKERIAWHEHYAIAGIQDLTFNTVNQLITDDRLVDGVTVLQVPDLLGLRITGVATSDVTNASTTALVDPRTRDWSGALIAAAGIPRSVLLPLSEPGWLVGEAIDPRLRGLPLIGVGTHDTASAFAGAPVVDRDAALIVSLGTWALIGYESTTAVPTEASLALDATHELGVDRTVRVLRNVSGMWLFEECRRAWSEEDGVAVAVPDLLDAMLAAPAFAAGFDVDAPALAAPGQSPSSIAPHLVGAWDGSRGAVVRVLLESLVARLATRARELASLSGTPRTTLHVVGGGARISALMQWLADATDMTVVAGPAEATAIGNALVQWTTDGALDSLAAGRRVIGALPEVRTFVPSGDRAAWEAFTARIEEGRHG